ncbi:Cilia- and flagella-associated protein 36 [Halotydeus destructor]|nr:Cilia- and flagella-associated protein 36 [Halotydeus destructor]
MSVEQFGDDADSDWVLDSLIGFLKGPVWHLPLLTFIEQQSVIFEPDDEDSNEEEYSKVYEEYKNLVDKLLAGHMDDLAITPEQFEEACRSASGTLSAKFHQTLFEQIWAANDYDIFKRMMVQRNIDLQLQALEMLAQRFGLIPDSFIPEGQTREEYLKTDGQLIDQVIKRSMEDTEPDEQFGDVAGHVERELNVSKSGNQFSVSPAELEVHSEPVNSKPEVESRAQHSHAIDADEIIRRQEYLRQQRDKLVEAKKKERQRQVSKVEESGDLLKRPKSAKVMRNMMDRTEGSDDEESVDRGHAFRLSLAARLKAEVIGG